MFFPGWLLTSVAGGYLAVGYLFPRLNQFIKAQRSRDWPRETATVLVSRMANPYGGDVAEIIYAYNHQGRHLSGTHRKRFFWNSAMKRYLATFPKGSSIVVRVKPEAPMTSIVRDRDQTRS